MRPNCVSYHLSLYKFIRSLGTYFKSTNKPLFIFVAGTIRNHPLTNGAINHTAVYIHTYTHNIVCKYDVQMKEQHSVDKYAVNSAYETTVLPRWTLVSLYNLNKSPTINLTKYNVDCIWNLERRSKTWFNCILNSITIVFFFLHCQADYIKRTTWATCVAYSYIGEMTNSYKIIWSENQGGRDLF
jgi:hypothetical protein